jgi:hypothetical protein
MHTKLMGFGIHTAPKALRYKWHPVAIFNLPPVPCNTLLSVKVTVLLWVVLLASMARRGHCISPGPLKMSHEPHRFANNFRIQEWAEDEPINDISLPLLHHSRRLTQSCPLVGKLFNFAAPSSFD